MAAALSRVYAGLCRRDRLTSKECPFWLDSLFCDQGHFSRHIEYKQVDYFKHACNIFLTAVNTEIYLALNNN